MQTNRRQSGFHLVELLIVVAVVGLIGFIMWLVWSRGGAPNATQTNTAGEQTQQSFVEWNFDGTNWKAAGTAPACEDPLAIASPMDVTKANAVLYPGQIRGGDFKPHGGIGTSGEGSVNVYALRDAYLYRGTRYIESGEVQYMFDFMDSCGVMYRLDHLHTLSAEFATYANLLPPPKVDDSRTTKFSDHVFVKKGTVVATAIGFAKSGNTFFDVGVYDLRHQNAAAQTSLYKTDSLRISDKEQSFFAVCWFDLLPSNDRTIVKALPPRGGEKESSSDYCK